MIGTHLAADCHQVLATRADLAMVSLVGCTGEGLQGLVAGNLGRFDDGSDHIGPIADGFAAMQLTGTGLRDDRTRLVVLDMATSRPGAIFDDIGRNELAAFMPDVTADEHVTDEQAAIRLRELFQPDGDRRSALRPTMVLKMGSLPQVVQREWAGKSLVAGPYLYVFVRERYEKAGRGGPPRYVLLTVGDRISSDRSLDGLHVPSPRDHLPGPEPRRGMPPCLEGSRNGSHRLDLRPIVAPSYPFDKKPIAQFVQGFMTLDSSGPRALEPMEDCERFIALPDMWHVDLERGLSFHTCEVDGEVHRTGTLVTPTADVSAVLDAAPRDHARCTNKKCDGQVFRGLSGSSDLVATVTAAYRDLPPGQRMRKVAP